MAADAKRYLRLKPKGVADIIKTEEGFALRFKRFDVEVGAELEQPELQPFVLEDIVSRGAEVRRELEGLNLIYEECSRL